jgi:hypothetical protein
LRSEIRGALADAYLALRGAPADGPNRDRLWAMAELVVSPGAVRALERQVSYEDRKDVVSEIHAATRAIAGEGRGAAREDRALARAYVLSGAVGRTETQSLLGHVIEGRHPGFADRLANRAPAREHSELQLNSALDRGTQETQTHDMNADDLNKTEAAGVPQTPRGDDAAQERAAAAGGKDAVAPAGQLVQPVPQKSESDREFAEMMAKARAEQNAELDRKFAESVALLEAAIERAKAPRDYDAINARMAKYKAESLRKEAEQAKALEQQRALEKQRDLEKAKDIELKRTKDRERDSGWGYER